MQKIHSLGKYEQLGLGFPNPNGEEIGRPADEEASRDLIILINSSVQEGLLAARGPCAPASRITAMADLDRTNRTQTVKMQDNIIVSQTEIYKTHIQPRTRLECSLSATGVNAGLHKVLCSCLASEHQWWTETFSFGNQFLFTSDVLGKADMNL